MKQNNNSNKLIFIILTVIVFVWLGFLTYKICQVEKLEQENSKVSSEINVKLIGEINKINQKLEKEAGTQAE